MHSRIRPQSDARVPATRQLLLSSMHRLNSRAALCHIILVHRRHICSEALPAAPTR